MKMVVAVVRPNKLDSIKKSLEEEGVRGITIAEARGHGWQKGQIRMAQEQESRIDLLPKTRIGMAVPDDQVEKVIQAILDSARTGEVGDGKIFILPMQTAYRIRTGETGTDAL